MNHTALQDFIRQHKGQFVRVVTARPLKPLKTAVKNGLVEEGEEIVKHSVYVGKAGIDYDNRAAVKEARESGDLPAENQGLNGKEWVEFPIILRGIRSGTLMVAITPSNAPTHRVRTVFTRNGEEIARETLDGIVGAKDWKPSNRTDCTVFHVPCKYVREFGSIDDDNGGQTVEEVETAPVPVNA
jgi:hypothetical protein